MERLAQRQSSWTTRIRAPTRFLELALVDLGDYDKALAETKLALDLNGSDADAYSGLLNVLLWSGDVDGAITAGEMLARFQPNLTTAQALILGVLLTYSQDRGADAVRILEPAADRNPMLFPADAMLAAAYAQVSRHADAERQLLPYVSVFPLLRATNSVLCCEILSYGRSSPFCWQENTGL